MKLPIHAVQIHQGKRWKTIAIASFLPDAVDSYNETLAIVTDPVRMVRFTVDSFDFISTYAVDYDVLSSRGACLPGAMRSGG